MSRKIAAALLFAQIAGVVWSRFIPEKYFCWSPYDRQTHYRIEARVGGRALTPGQVRVRYQLYPEGWDDRSPHNVFDKLRQYEETYGRGQNAEIVVRYAVNGRPEETWRWPER